MPAAPDDRVVVVTGLPRSGTSMLMQMLDAGGVPVLTDRQRQPDDDNPRGYYEVEAVKALASDSSVVRAAAGRAVKVVAPLLPHLPAGLGYDVLGLHRPIAEVLASQRKMLDRLGKAGAALDPAKLGPLLERQFEQGLSAVARHAGSRRLDLRYAEVVDDAGAAAKAIVGFLSDSGWQNLDADAMAAAVDPSLYRNRA